LESNLISNLGLTGLSKALIDNESLEELYLYNNDIEDESIDAFLGMLKNKTKLKVLGIEYNKIRHKGDGIFRTVTQFPEFERLLIS